MNKRTELPEHLFGTNAVNCSVNLLFNVEWVQCWTRNTSSLQPSLYLTSTRAVVADSNGGPEDTLVEGLVESAAEEVEEELVLCYKMIHLWSCMHDFARHPSGVLVVFIFVSLINHFLGWISGAGDEGGEGGAGVPSVPLSLALDSTF